MAARQRDYLTADEAYAAHAGKAAADLRDIAAAGAADRTVAESRALADDQVRAARSLARWSGVRVVALAVCGRFPPLLLLLGAPWLLRNGLTPGALVGALTYLTQALAPAVQALMTMLSTVGGRLLVVLDRFTDAPPPPAADDRPPSVPPVRGSAPVAELRAVTFAYGPAAHPVLDRLSLTVAPGEHLAVVGPSGSGKSTLAAVIAGVERPTAGAVRWHGRPVRPADATAVRVLLPQHAYVFTGSLRDNLRYLRPAAGDRDLAAMIEALGLDPLLSRLGSLDAPLEPDRLSQGERQLVALGRAYVAAPPLIVLDEATSRLDPAAETRAEPRLRRPAGRPGGRRPPAQLGPARRPDPRDGRTPHLLRHLRGAAAHLGPLPGPGRTLGTGRRAPHERRTGRPAPRERAQIQPASFALLMASTRLRAPDFRMAAAR